MKPTRAQVAKKAGVSTATVSYVLNNSRGVAAETREKVLRAVKELNYVPDMVARSMVTRETKQLSIVVNDIVNPFFGEIILGFENEAIANGYFVNICTGYKNLDAYLENFISRRIDGVFIGAIPYKFHIEKIYDLVANGIKVVISGNTEVDLKRISAVENDYVTAMDQAIKYLADLGHRNIAYLNGLNRHSTFDHRVAGYWEAMAKYGLPVEEKLLWDDKAPYNTTPQDGYNLTQQLIASGTAFSALICTNDLMALGAMNALKKAGYRIPEDVSVIGFDGINIGALWEPALTTLSVPKHFLGKKAFELLYTNIKKGNSAFYLNQLELVVRQSTGPCRAR